MDHWNLAGRRALVTGASRGIGRAVAEELMALGAEVLGIARGRQGLEDCSRDWAERGLNGSLRAIDITESAERATLVEAMEGRLDILVNNAGMNIRRDAIDYSETEVRHILELNQMAAFELSRALHPALAASIDGRVVNVASVSGLVSTRTGTPYAMSKAALIQMTKSLAVEWARDGIRVNAVAPWYVRTELVAALLEDDAYRRRVLDRTPLDTLGDPRDVASAVAYFCLPASQWVTGQCLAVDGGFGAHGFAPE